MAFKRPHPRQSGSGSSSSVVLSGEHPLKRPKIDSELSSAFAGSVSDAPIRVFVVQAKLDSQTISDLFSILEDDSREKALLGNSKETQPDSLVRGSHRLRFALSRDAADADVIITVVRMRKRLERHVDWEVAEQKAIVTPKWLFDCMRQNEVLPYEDYVPLSDLHDRTGESRPNDSYPNPRSNLSPSPRVLTPPSSDNPSSDASSHPSLIYKDLDASHARPDSQDAEAALNNSHLSYSSRYACMRASPLVCPNQSLANQLEVLRKSRELEGESINALSYEKAISVIKAYPHIITSQNLLAEVSKLPHIGPKILIKIEEYLSSGQVTETQKILSSARHKALSDFTTVYGIGPSTARGLYDQGLRTISDLERYYDVDVPIEITDTPAINDDSVLDQIFEGSDKDAVDIPPTMSIQMGLLLRRDFNLKIPRAEVEEIHRVIMGELSHLQQGCVSTIVGGYRRGKSESNDVDIVITHSDAENGAAKVKGLCAKLVKRLNERDLVTHVMHLSSFRPQNALRTGHWDSLEKALTVFALPPTDNLSSAPQHRGGSTQIQKGKQREVEYQQTRLRRIHRRVDLIFAAPEAYWTAIVGWTGSTMFERDLRLYAKQKKGYKFDSTGITRRHDSKVFYPRSEQEVFEILGLEWIDPKLRNANV